MDLYNYQGQNNDNPLESMTADEILKAMEAGLMTGMQYDNQLNNGGGLKPESLDYVLKNLENRLDQLVFWNELPRQRIESTVHQYNQFTNTDRTWVSSILKAKPRQKPTVFTDVNLS